MFCHTLNRFGHVVLGGSGIPLHQRKLIIFECKVDCHRMLPAWKKYKISVYIIYQIQNSFTRLHIILKGSEPLEIFFTILLIEDG
jgi:hypothetical protein